MDWDIWLNVWMETETGSHFYWVGGVGGTKLERAQTRCCRGRSWSILSTHPNAGYHYHCNLHTLNIGYIPAKQRTSEDALRDAPFCFSDSSCKSLHKVLDTDKKKKSFLRFSLSTSLNYLPLYLKKWLGEEWRRKWRGFSASQTALLQVCSPTKLFLLKTGAFFHWILSTF